jgi:hypothetical protein
MMTHYMLLAHIAYYSIGTALYLYTHAYPDIYIYIYILLPQLTLHLNIQLSNSKPVEGLSKLLIFTV